MPKYVIEREVPGAGEWTPEQVQKTSAASNAVLQELGGDVQWVTSYVTGDKLYCVYIAPNEERVREHARMGGFPANSVNEVRTVMDPTTGGR
jgi:hypothetical protein